MACSNQCLIGQIISSAGDDRLVIRRILRCLLCDVTSSPVDHHNNAWDGMGGGFAAVGQLSRADGPKSMSSDEVTTTTTTTNKW